eukprot:768669-Hanusia_phi.AAC.4
MVAYAWRGMMWLALMLTAWAGEGGGGSGRGGGDARTGCQGSGGVGQAGLRGSQSEGKSRISTPGGISLPASRGLRNEVLGSNAAPVRRESYEHAGRTYEERRRRQFGEDPGIEIDENAGAGRQQVSSEAEAKRRERKVHETDAVKRALAGEDDLYALLGLGERRWQAGEEELKKAFHRTSLLCHPDKVVRQGLGSVEAADEAYKRINRAYQILSDKTKVGLSDITSKISKLTPW